MFKAFWNKLVSFSDKLLYPNLVKDLGLYETVLICKTEELACRIAKKITNEDLLKKLADHQFSGVRILALNTLRDKRLAERMAIHDAVWQVRLEALQYVTSKRTLNRVALDQNKKVSTAAKKRLKEIAHGKRNESR